MKGIVTFNFVEGKLHRKYPNKFDISLDLYFPCRRCANVEYND